MTLFDLPLQPLDDGRYVVLVNHEAVPGFDTRTQALAHAVAQAAELAERGLASAIHIEGGDGRWRTYRG